MAAALTNEAEAPLFAPTNLADAIRLAPSPRDRLVAVRRLLDGGADVRARLLVPEGAADAPSDASGRMPGCDAVHLAVGADDGFGDPDLVRLLAARGAPLNGWDSGGNTALCRIMSYVRAVCRMRGADPERARGLPRGWATIRALLECGADPNIPSIPDSCALWEEIIPYAADPALVAALWWGPQKPLLVSEGFSGPESTAMGDVTVPGYWPLHCLAYHLRDEATWHFILSHGGADQLAARNEYGDSPLDFAILGRNVTAAWVMMRHVGWDRRRVAVAAWAAMR